MVESTLCLSFMLTPPPTPPPVAAVLTLRGGVSCCTLDVDDEEEGKANLFLVPLGSASEASESSWSLIWKTSMLFIDCRFVWPLPLGLEEEDALDLDRFIQLNKNPLPVPVVMAVSADLDSSALGVISVDGGDALRGRLDMVLKGVV